MGALSLPASGTVYVDTQAVIYSVETHARYWSLLEPIWLALEKREITVVTSELTLLEVLIGPLKNQDKILENAYESVLTASGVNLFSVSQAVLREAARLRASIASLRTPDAIHAATAMQHGCDLFITNDLGYRRIPELPLVILDDLLTPDKT